MSSLQKFHRRTNGGTPPAPPMIVNGNLANGIWMGTDSSTNEKLILAAFSTEVAPSSYPWGSSGTTRNTVSTTNGLANTNTLVSFGQAAHPMAYYCKTLTSGGYNTWFLPASDQLLACGGGTAARTGVFAQDSGLTGPTGSVFLSSTEISTTKITAIRLWDNYAYTSGSYNVKGTGTYNYRFRAMRIML